MHVHICSRMGTYLHFQQEPPERCAFLGWFDRGFALVCRVTTTVSGPNLMWRGDHWSNVPIAEPDSAWRIRSLARG